MITKYLYCFADDIDNPDDTKSVMEQAQKKAALKEYGTISAREPICIRKIAEFIFDRETFEDCSPGKHERIIFIFKPGDKTPHKMHVEKEVEIFFYVREESV